MIKLLRITVFVIFSITYTNFVSGQKNDPTPEDMLNFYTNEVELLNLKNGDTLVDVGAGGGSINGMYSIIRNNLYQILTDIDKKELNEKVVKSNYKYLKNLYHPTNSFSYSLLIHKQHSIPLKSKSFDKFCVGGVFTNSKNRLKC